MKKILVFVILILSTFFISACTEENNKNISNENTNIKNNVVSKFSVWTWSGTYYGIVIEDKLYNKMGECVGLLQDDYIYNSSGRYIGEIRDGNRLIRDILKANLIGPRLTPTVNIASPVPQAAKVANVMIPGFRDFDK